MQINNENKRLQPLPDQMYRNLHVGLDDGHWEWESSCLQNGFGELNIYFDI